MFVAVCIFSAKNFYELDAYRAEKAENINQKTIITRLTNENAELKSEKLAVQSSENLESIVTDFIETHYRSNDEIKQETLIKSAVWQIKDNHQATAFADLEITFTYSDKTKMRILSIHRLHSANSMLCFITAIAKAPVPT